MNINRKFMIKQNYSKKGLEKTGEKQTRKVHGLEYGQLWKSMSTLITTKNSSIRV